MAGSPTAKQPRGQHQDPPVVENPKANPDPVSNQIKDPDDWVTCLEPTNGPQAS